MDPFVALDAVAQADLVRRKEVTPLELVDAAIARIERLNPRLNAVISTQFEEAREQARRPLPPGPFAGVPFLLKDFLAAQAGVPLTAGSRFLKDYVPQHDSELVARYKRAGLVVLGKTNLSEYGILPTAEPRQFGATRNPWNMETSPGGSSGGAAAAVASGMVPFAHAADGGGSIRIPASCCGLFGLKPTRGRLPMGPEVGDVMHGLVVEHALTRTVRDSAALLDATEGPDTGAPYFAPPKARPFLQEVTCAPERLRIGVETRPSNGVPVHPECITAVEAAARLLTELGHTVVEGSLAVPDEEQLSQAFIVLWSSGVVLALDGMALLSGQEPAEEHVEPLTWALYELGRSQSISQYLLAHAAAQRLARAFSAHWEDVDVWLTPTLAEPPPPLGSFEPSRAEPLDPLVRASLFCPFTQLANVTGQPAMSVPLHWTREGLPVGVQFTGRYGDEATLLRLAGQLESALPWGQRRPPVFG
ncbi:amidase [Myxococcaceae bacterium GXIMD 01537]